MIPDDIAAIRTALKSHTGEEVHVAWAALRRIEEHTRPPVIATEVRVDGVWVPADAAQLKDGHSYRVRSRYIDRPGARSLFADDGERGSGPR